MTDLPYEVNLWGNRMEMLSNGRPVRFEEYLAVYRESFGPGGDKKYQPVCGGFAGINRILRDF